MMIALVIAFVVGFPAVCGAAFLLVWRLCELHDRRLRDVMDRIQAPEAAHVAAFEQAHPRREHSLSTAPDGIPVLLDEDFQLADLIEESI